MRFWRATKRLDTRSPHFCVSLSASLIHKTEVHRKISFESWLRCCFNHLWTKSALAILCPLVAHSSHFLFFWKNLTISHGKDKRTPSQRISDIPSLKIRLDSVPNIKNDFRATGHRFRFSFAIMFMSATSIDLLHC